MPAESLMFVIATVLVFGCAVAALAYAQSTVTVRKD